jgi:catechol 2,3-dioxygenase-like lactoylglutathione lyase family enzyme
MAIKRIDLAWVTVADFERSKKFFVETLGLVTLCSEDEQGWLELVGEDGGAVLGVGKSSKQSDDKPGQNAVITFTVDDLLKTKKLLEAQGVIFIGDVIEVPGHVKMIFFTDPDNNKYQLVEDMEEEDDDEIELQLEE